MIIGTYRRTPGLEHFPEQARYRAWREIHDSLMRADGDYRRRVNKYLTHTVSTSVIYCCALSAPVFVRGIVPESRAGMVLIWAAATLAFVVFVLYGSFRLQEYENRRIGEELQKSAKHADLMARLGFDRSP